MSNLGVPFSSQFFLWPPIQPSKILLILSVQQLFLSVHTAELSSKLSLSLHLCYCNIISLAFATVIWPILHPFRMLLPKGFVASHLIGNQPTFASICVISDISCMSWTQASIMLTHFSPLERSLKCLFCHAYKNLTVVDLLKFVNFLIASCCYPACPTCICIHLLYFSYS